MFLEIILQSIRKYFITKIQKVTGKWFIQIQMYKLPHEFKGMTQTCDLNMLHYQMLNSPAPCYTILTLQVTYHHFSLTNRISYFISTWILYTFYKHHFSLYHKASGTRSVCGLNQSIKHNISKSTFTRLLEKT